MPTTIKAPDGFNQSEYFSGLFDLNNTTRQDAYADEVDWYV